ncbi:MAG: GIY-YIG nuclease family protein [Candidatus Omnitrophica bacterium]|nr:GIY-YIG nuclease family protein [Candidatus Omnitrophota bacterium]
MNMGFVYLLMNKSNTVIYTGVTRNLVKRIYEHKNKLVDGFTKKYNVTKLVYFEVFDDLIYATIREKQIKAGSRDDKLKLIAQNNPHYFDLYDEIAASY